MPALSLSLSLSMYFESQVLALTFALVVVSRLTVDLIAFTQIIYRFLRFIDFISHPIPSIVSLLTTIVIRERYIYIHSHTQGVKTCVAWLGELGSLQWDLRFFVAGLWRLRTHQRRYASYSDWKVSYSRCICTHVQMSWFVVLLWEHNTLHYANTMKGYIWLVSKIGYKLTGDQRCTELGNSLSRVSTVSMWILSTLCSNSSSSFCCVAFFFRQMMFNTWQSHASHRSDEVCNKSRNKTKYTQVGETRLFSQDD